MLPAFLLFAVSVEVTGVSATQATIAIQGAEAPCTITLTGPRGVHPDVSGSQDSSRPDTIVWKDGTRIVTLGHQRGALALASDTEYRGTLTGCGNVPFVVRTRPLLTGAILPLQLPVRADNWHNADFPAIDWSAEGRDKWYTDPLTGIQLKVLNRNEDFSWSNKNNQVFAHWAGGAGWENAPSAVNGATSTARTSNTNPLMLYPVLPYEPYAASMTLENIGLLVWGFCTGSGADCDIEAGISFNPSKGFAGTPFTIRLPAGNTMARPSGGSAHKFADGAFPAQYPRPLFAGWGNVRITRDRFIPPSPATATRIRGGVLEIDAPEAGGVRHVPRTVEAGQHVWMQEPGCSGNICTVASVQDAGSMKLVENINADNRQFRPLPWGILVRKKTANGSVQTGFQYRAAGTTNASTGTLTVRCSPVEQTDPDGVKGHPCALPDRNAYAMLYFISNDAEVVRPIAALNAWNIAPGRGFNISFSPSDGRVMFMQSGQGVYRLTYKGNWKDSVWGTEDGRYLVNPGGDWTYFDEQIVWEPAVVPSAVEQITAAYPKQVSPPYPAWTTGNLAGISGNTAVLYRVLNGAQDDGPCQIAVFDLVTGKIRDFINTVEQDGPVAWGNCHSVQINSMVPDTLMLSLNIMNVKNPAKMSAGPFQAPVEAVMRGGKWDQNACLEWPPNTGTQCAGAAAYDKACPAGLSSEYTDMGATGDACVKLLFGGHPCNLYPSEGDKQAYGTCPWNPAYSGAPKLRPGMSLVDSVAGGAAPGDSEHFRILTVRDTPDKKVEVVAQRDGVRDYCCSMSFKMPPVSSGCVAGDRLFTHAGGWTALMTPGSKASCNSAAIHITWDSSGRRYTELSRSMQGHAAYGHGPNDTMRYLAGGGIRNLPDFFALGKQPPSALIPTAVAFDGVPASIGKFYQQYLNHSQYAAADAQTIWSLDANAVNPAVGIGGNNMGNGIGPRPNALFQQVSGSVWKLSAIDTVAYKSRPLLGWAGPLVLGEVSGPGSRIDTAPDYSQCFALRAGECYAGSAAGDVFVKVPKTFRHKGSQNTICQTGMEFANIPCVLSGGAVAGYIRQFRSDREDMSGSDQRLVSSALRPYGTHYPYWAAVAHPAAQVVLFSSGGFLEGMRQVIFAARLPQWVSSGRRNAPGGLLVGLGPSPGITQARIRFGYDVAFRCTARREACLTNAALAPYAFDSEPLTPLECAKGCEIVVPALPGRLLYYRIERFNGTAWVAGDTLTAFP